MLHTDQTVQINCDVTNSHNMRYRMPDTSSIVTNCTKMIICVYIGYPLSSLSL